MPNQSRFTEADRIRAIEENGTEFLLAMGRAAGAEEYRTPEIHWVIGSSPIDYHNCVVRAQLTSDTADVAISASIERFEALGVPGSWHVGPSMQPPDLGDRLRRHGFVEAEEDIGTAIDLGALPEAGPVPESFTIERVVDERGLTAWTSVIAQSFGEGEPEAVWVGEVYRRIGLSEEVPWRHLLGRLAGEPVATASLFIGAGAAGVYFVSTRPSARRQGIGAAMTLAALRTGWGLGSSWTCWARREPGTPSTGMGFRELCRIHLCEWRAP